MDHASAPRSTADTIAEPDFSSMTDMIALVQAVREMKLTPLLVAVILPFMLIAMVIFPLDENRQGYFACLSRDGIIPVPLPVQYNQRK